MAEKTIAEVGIKDTAVAKESAAIDTAATTAAAATPTLTSQVNDASQADITNEDLFPGMNQKINVGSSSSQTLGTQPIFVAAGQYVPYNILNKKEEAIAAATKKRAERQAKFAPPKPGELTNKLYQGKLNKSFNKNISDVISTAQKMDPDNWDKNLNNPGSEIGKIYAQQLSNFDVLAKESNVIFDRVAFVKAQKETGGATQFSPDTIKFADEVMQGLAQAGDGGIVDVGYYRDKFNGSFSLDNHLMQNKYVAQMKAEITAELAAGGGGMTVEQKEVYREKARQLAKSQTSAGGTYDGDNLITEDVYFNRLDALLGTEQTLTHKFKPTAGGTYGSKKRDIADRTQKRYETEKAILLDHKSQKAQEALGSLKGQEYAGNINTNAVFSNPEDYDEHRASGKSLTDFYNDSKDKKDPGFWSAFGSTNPTIESSKFKEDIVGNFNTERAKLGLEGDISSFTVDPKNKNIITVKNNKAQTTKIDMSNPEAVEDYLLGDDAKWKNDAAIKITYDDDGRPKTMFLGLDPVKYPDSFSVLNTMLNSGEGEDLQVIQEDLRTKREAEPEVWGVKSKLVKNQKRKETDKEINKKKVTERLQSSYPQATPKDIESFIKHNATDEQIKDFLESKKNK